MSLLLFVPPPRSGDLVAVGFNPRISVPPHNSHRVATLGPLAAVGTPTGAFLAAPQSSLRDSNQPSRHDSGP
jgi:hypothetical protein